MAASVFLSSLSSGFSFLYAKLAKLGLMQNVETGRPASAHGTVAVLPKIGTINWRAIKPLYAIIAGLMIAALAALFVSRTVFKTPIALITVPVTQGTLVRNVTASGTVNPQDTVSIGSQVSGTISEIDVDFNSVVHRGQILARIDPTSLQASLDQARSQLAQTEAQAQQAASTAIAAQANIAVTRDNAAASLQAAQATRASAAAQQAAISTAQANVAKAQSGLTLAEQTFARDRSLLSQGYIAQTQADTDQATLAGAQSAYAAAQSGLVQARAQAAASAGQANQALAQSQSMSAQQGVTNAQADASNATAAAQAAAIGIQSALVKQAQLNLDRTIITSPVNGTVIARNISVGNTVAASFQTPTLFTIARNLGKMEVDLAVGESDIGSLKAGDVVDFTVLAYPNQTFRGIVQQVRQDPTVAQNVVTYTTVVMVDNKAGLLRPGMTANAMVHVQKVDNALIVPTAALTYRPSAAAAQQFHLPKPGRPLRKHRAGAGADGASRAAAGSQWGATQGADASAITAGSRGRLFVQRSGALVAVPVKIALTSGTQAAVTPLRGTLQSGDHVVTDDSSAAGASGSGSAAKAPALKPPGGFGRGLH